MLRFPPQLRSFTAALLAVLWGATPVLFLAHGEHVHRYCAEHRAFEEAGTADAAGAPADAAKDGLSSAMPGLAVGGEHLACPLLRAAAGAVPVPAPSAGPAEAAAPREELAVRAEAPAFAPLAVLDSAPKASPPLAA
jgi:hypothetical protein